LESAVPDIVRQVSDDQIALIVCFGAILASGLIMHFSIHIGRLTGRVRLHQTPDHGTILMPEMLPAPVRGAEEIAIRERAA
jgi:hypothetical protein